MIICLWGRIKNGNEITLFDWYNSLSADGMTNIGYYDDVILMDVLFSLIKID